MARLPGNENNDDHSFVATPGNLFVDPFTNGDDPALSDYRLLAASAARDAGTSTLAALLDLDGKPRPIGATIDVGAYEFGTASLTGDFNRNGTVDAADYTVWRNGLGSTYDQDDYDDWKSHFGESNDGTGAAGSANAGASAVPEPTMFILLSALFLTLVASRRAIFDRNSCGCI